MKLSEFFLTALKNFSTINSSIVLQAGNVQKSISADKSILVEAEFDDNIPHKFGIYDLNQFLGNVTTLENPELTFSDQNVVMNDGTFQLTYNACSPVAIVSPPEKELVMKSIDVSFRLNMAVMQKLLRLSSMNNFHNLSLVCKNGQLEALGHDRKDDTSNKLSTPLGPCSAPDFNVSFRIENFKFIPDDYDVEVTLGGFAKFTSVNRKLKYFVSLESK